MEIFVLYLNGYSDAGWPLSLATLYLIFGVNIIIPRIVNALLGSWMVLIVYRLTKRNFGENSAKVAAVLTALMPILIYYIGLHLKETLMVFLLLYFIEQGDLLIRKTKVNKFFLFSKLLILSISLFFFRTVLGLAAIFSFFMGMLFHSSRKNRLPIKVVKAGFFIVLLSFFVTSTLKMEIYRSYNEKDTNLERQMRRYARRGNKIARYGKASVFLPVILVAPFPAMVNTEQPNHHMINGAIFVRNILAFFVLISFLTLWKRKKIRNSLFILFFLGAYLIMLANTGFALSGRFHLPAIPIIIIFASHGIVNLKNIYKINYSFYLILIFVLIFSWNMLKLVGRGKVSTGLKSTSLSPWFY